MATACRLARTAPTQVERRDAAVESPMPLGSNVRTPFYRLAYRRWSGISRPKGKGQTIQAGAGAWSASWIVDSERSLEPWRRMGKERPFVSSLNARKPCVTDCSDTSLALPHVARATTDRLTTAVGQLLSNLATSTTPLCGECKGEASVHSPGNVVAWLLKLDDDRAEKGRL